MKRVFDDFPWVVGTSLPELERHRDHAIDDVLRQYSGWPAPADEFNFRVSSNDDLFEKLYDCFVFHCRCYFRPFTMNPCSRRTCWAYVQNRENYRAILHDHVRTATINGVYYLSVPDDSGALEFRHLERTWSLTPQEGSLYVFPCWLAHKPAPQSSTAYRISINVEIITNEYPITRERGLRW